MRLRLTVVSGRPSCSPMSRERGWLDGSLPISTLPAQSCCGENREVYARWVHVGYAIGQQRRLMRSAMSYGPWLAFAHNTASRNRARRLPGCVQSDRHLWSSICNLPRYANRTKTGSCDVGRPSRSSASANSSSMKVRGIRWFSRTHLAYHYQSTIECY